LNANNNIAEIAANRDFFIWFILYLLAWKAYFMESSIL